jgi:hypothetical protein
LKKKVGTVEQAQRDSDTLFQSLRSKWEEIDLSRTLEQQRRRRVIDEQSHFHQERNINLVSSMYLSHSQNESNVEYDLTSHLRKIRAEKERIKKNRAARLELIEQQQQREKDNAQRRNLEEQNRHNVDEQNCVSETQGRINYLRAANQKTQNALLKHICHEVVEDVLDIVSLLVEERDNLGLVCLPLEDMWNEWNTLFKNNMKLPEHISTGTVNLVEPYSSSSDVNLLLSDVIGFRTNTGIWKGTKFILYYFDIKRYLYIFFFFFILFIEMKKQYLRSPCRKNYSNHHHQL